MKKHTKTLNIESVSKIYEEQGSLERAAKIIGCGRSKLQSFCSKNNIKRSYAIDHEIFSEITPQNSYWAGFIAADGCVYQKFLKVVIQERDREHINKMLMFLKSSRKAKIFKGYARLEIKSKKIVENLSKHFNIVPNKSLILRPPNIDNEELVRNFIRGYVDGDGCLYVDKENVIQVGITSGSREILEWINNIFNIKLQIRTKITKKYNKKYNKHYSTITYFSQKAETILNWIYENSNAEFRLDRKYEKYKKLMGIRKKIKKRKGNLRSEIEEMRKMYKGGLTYKEIAEKINIKYSKVAYHLGKASDIKKFKGVRAGRVE